MTVHGFSTAGADLLVGGVPLRRLAARVGQTPFYAYDRALIEARVQAVRGALPPGLHLSYAIKANPMPALVCALRPWVDGFDVASAGELAVALDAGMDPGAVSFAGPGKRDAELQRAVAAGVTITLESAAEAERLHAAGVALGLRPRAALRINPDFALRGAGMRMGGGASPFGVDAGQAPDVLRRLGALDLEFRGFHVFWGSQALRADLVSAAQRQALDLVLRLLDAAPAAPPLVNLGGGFGIPYFTKDTPLDLAAVGAAMAPLVEDLAAACPQARLGLELGRYLVGEAGVYVCRVVDRKESRGRVFLITDGGLHHHLAATGNFGQVVRRDYPLTTGSRLGAPPEEVTVTGCLCTPLDVLAERACIPRAEVGDLIVIFQSGAYGRSASPGDFLGHPAVAEVLV